MRHSISCSFNLYAIVDNNYTAAAATTAISGRHLPAAVLPMPEPQPVMLPTQRPSRHAKYHVSSVSLQPTVVVSPSRRTQPPCTLPVTSAHPTAADNHTQRVQFHPALAVIITATVLLSVKVKVGYLLNSVAYMSQTSDQKRFYNLGSGS